jgi:serine/threonine protein kinase
MQPADPRLLSLRDALVGQVLRGSAGVKYYLRERIGEGGQGWVFKANWEEPGGLVVIAKVLRPDAVHGESLPRFQREAEVLRMLSQQPRPNPYVVRFYDHAVAHFAHPETRERVALPFTVLEYVNGPTLEQVLSQTRGRGLPVERARRIARQVVFALELVHSQNVVHRDLKPSNILLATEQAAEVAKVTDFGIVKVVDINLQRTTTLAGASLGYAPPEQYEQGNQRVTPKTDLFSFAAILFEMLTGELAFPFSERENPLLIVTRILNGPRPDLSKKRVSPGLSDKKEVIDRLDAEFRRAFAADPTDRHASVTEFWAMVEPLLRDSGGHDNVGPPSKLPFADTDLSRTRPSAGSVDHQTQLSGAPGINPAQIRINPSAAPAASSSVRARPLENASNPSAWTWRVATRPIRGGLVQAASFADNGELAVGAGPTGLARWEKGAWAALAAPPGVDARAVRGVRLVAGGDLLVFGERSLAARLGQRGAYQIWSVPEQELTFHAAIWEPGDVTTLVGERSLRRSAAASNESIGCVAQVVADRVSFVTDAPASNRLRGVARLVSGPLIACGDWGSLVRIDGAAVEHVGPICRGHLVAVEALDDGTAVTVGAGGHALHISRRLDAALEAVQTTRDLLCLAVGGDGAAWAGAAQARLLRRTTDSWVRMSGDVGITPSVVAIWASERVVRAICDDGAVIEGRIG